MTADTLAWFAAETGLPLVEELDGTVRTHSPVGEPEAGCDLPGAVAHVTGLSPADPSIAELLRRARGGLRTSMVLGSHRVVSVPPSAGTVRLLFVPLTDGRGPEAGPAGVAHELSNALGAISGWAELARRPGAAPETVTLALERIERSARTARETARHLLGAARGSVVGAPPADMGLVVRESLEQLEPVADAAGVELQSLTAPDLHVAAPRPPLFSIVSNLVQNAIEASPRGGVVAIEARRRRGRVRIEVADQGSGISEADRARIFDPYFTTKPQGTGLGLALVRQAVEALGGKLGVRSRPDHGARFAVELPYASEVGEHAAPPPIQPTQSGVRARAVGLDLHVLVVENDQAMRELVKTTLELQGATVVAVAGSTGAYAADGVFDVALLDLGLDVRGDAVLSELRRRGSVAAAALVTGSAPPSDLDPRGEPDAWIRKPFDLEELVDTVVRVGTRGRSALLPPHG